MVVGEMLGLPIKQVPYIVYEYKSKLDSIWKECTSKWDMEKYLKYQYEVRILTKYRKEIITLGELMM